MKIWAYKKIYTTNMSLDCRLLVSQSVNNPVIITNINQGDNASAIHPVDDKHTAAHRLNTWLGLNKIRKQVQLTNAAVDK